MIHVNLAPPAPPRTLDDVIADWRGRPVLVDPVTGRMTDDQRAVIDAELRPFGVEIDPTWDAPACDGVAYRPIGGAS